MSHSHSSQTDRRLDLHIDFIDECEQSAHIKLVSERRQLIERVLREACEVPVVKDRLLKRWQKARGFEEGATADPFYPAYPGYPADDRVLRFELVLVNALSNTSQEANRDFRDRDRPTNVLSFPAELEAVELSFFSEALSASAESAEPADQALSGALPLGDLILCAEVIQKEATDQAKTLNAHYAHLACHGLLHLLGYDHAGDDEADEMEALEIQLLDRLGFANPYQAGKGQAASAANDQL